MVISNTFFPVGFIFFKFLQLITRNIFVDRRLSQNDTFILNSYLPLAQAQFDGVFHENITTVFINCFLKLFFLIKNKTKTNIMCILKLSVLHSYTEGKVQHEKKRAALSMDSQYSLAIIQTVVLNAELLAYLPC